MIWRNRFFTYPVLSNEKACYVNSSFNSEVESSLEGYNLKLVLKAHLKNKELEAMLDENTVMIVHHIECPQTCFRDIVKTEKYEISICLSDSQVNGLVQVCSFLVANKDIPKYSNSFLANEYKGFKFDIQRGCIMAIGNQFDVRVEKTRDDLVNASSIFAIVPKIDPSNMEIDINLTENKIAIGIPETVYAVYSNMSSYMDVQPLMHSMFIIPALMNTFYELRDSDELFVYEDYKWFRGLKKACAKMNVEINEDTLKTLDIFSISQRLMDSPTIKGIIYLGEGANNDEN